MVGSGFRSSGHFSFIHQLSKKWHRLASTASDRKSANISEKFHKKGPVMVILVPGMIQPSQSVMFLMKWGCKGHWGHGGRWGCRGHWDYEGSKVWKITTEDFRVIQVLEFSFILMFWKKYWFGRFMKYHIEIYHLFCQRLLRPADVTFLKTGGWNSNAQYS